VRLGPPPIGGAGPLRARRIGQLDGGLALGEAVGAARAVAGLVVDEANAGVERQAGVQVVVPNSAWRRGS
jgi:hypothetical protein